jgi:SNF2 family DNA or RNA helicase
VVTSSESYNRRVRDVWDDEKICWGRIIRDESHLAKNKNTAVIRDIKALPGSPFMWALSGTPLERSPDDLDGYIDVLRELINSRGKKNQITWDVPPLIFAREAEFRELSREHGYIVRNGKESRKGNRHHMLLFLAHVLKALMIRRTMETTGSKKRSSSSQLAITMKRKSTTIAGITSTLGC